VPAAATKPDRRFSSIATGVRSGKGAGLGGEGWRREQGA
jgi:hypothetical protein